MGELLEAMRRNRDAGICPMHMPGHRRNTALFQMENPYGLDITEAEGFDNLHDAHGILRRAMDRAAALYGSAAGINVIKNQKYRIFCLIQHTFCLAHRYDIHRSSFRNCHFINIAHKFIISKDIIYQDNHSYRAYLQPFCHNLSMNQSIINSY